MIFVISGSSDFPFDRLVECIDSLAGNNSVKEPVFMQIGSSKYVPTKCEWKRFLLFDEMKEMAEKSHLVIAHAGVGALMLCLLCGKKPILVPRKERSAECIDDHQIDFAKKMQELGLADAVTEVNDLSNAINERIKDNSCNVLEFSERAVLVNYLEGLLSL